MTHTRGDLIIAHGLKYLGHEEAPIGSNTDHGGTIDVLQAHYGLHGEAWCAMFVGWVIATTPHLDKPFLQRAAGCIAPGTATTWANAQRSGWAHPKGAGLPVGSLFIKPGDAGHVGFVRRQLGGGRFESLEGNSGDGVRSRERSWADGWMGICIVGTGKPL